MHKKEITADSYVGNIVGYLKDDKGGRNASGKCSSLYPVSGVPTIRMMSNCGS